MRRGGRPTRKRRGGSARPAARKMRRGGRPRRMAHGGSHNGNMMNNSCPPGQHMMPAVNGNPAHCMDDSAMRNMSGRMYGHGGSHSRNNGCGAGMMMSNGGCVPMSGGYRRGGRTRSNRRMMHGGVHNGSGVNTPSGTQPILHGGTMSPHAAPSNGVNYGPVGRQVARLNGGGYRRGGRARGRR
tara:strand:+ start:145 stop:696 length:552 start_codon:yes stop_codon:yes gene_type:complete